MADALTGATARKQYRLAAAQNAEQKARIAEEERKVAAVEDGQRRLKGGGRGFLAFLEGMDQSALGDTLGGPQGAVPGQSKSKRKTASDYLADKAA